MRVDLYDPGGYDSQNDRPRAALTARKDGPRLDLFDEKGKAIWQAP